MITSIIVLSIDRKREENANDDFSGGKLFYRYGRQIINSTIPIGVDNNNRKPLKLIADELIQYITSEINTQFNGLSGRFQCNLVNITDRKMPNDSRKFIKTTLITKRHSEINYFILILGVGNQIVIHEYLFLKGQMKWHAPIWFVLTSPLHIWVWFYPWLMRNYSVYAGLKNSYNKSTYDFIDIITIIRGISFLFSTRLKDFAKKEGLLTEDLNLVLNQNISNSQNINIANSSRVSLNNITGKIRA